MFALGPGRQLEETEVAEGRVKLVWRNMAFLGQESVWAAEAAQCAAEQGQFWPYHDKLFMEQAGENQGAFSKENLKRFAREIGLQPAPFDACLDSDRYADSIRAERQAGQQKGVRSTPTLFINDQIKLEGVPTYDRLRQAIDTVAPSPSPSAR